MRKLCTVIGIIAITSLVRLSFVNAEKPAINENEIKWRGCSDDIHHPTRRC